MSATLVQLLGLGLLAIVVQGSVPTQVDYEPFRRAVANVVKQPVQPITESSTFLDCHFPEKSVMFTYTSHYMTDLMDIQLRAMNASGLGHCLRQRFVHLCLDTKCHQHCRENKIPHCALVNFDMLPPSDFNKGEYRFFTYLKHILLNEALKVAEEAFFFDADCIVMKNPFVEAQYHRSEDGTRHYGPVDIQFQRDRGRGNSCGGTVNSGQIYLRNSTQVQHYLQAMLGYQDTIMEGKSGLDQDFVTPAINQANLTHCSLAAHLYTAHCYTVFGNIQYINNASPVNDVVTYHTSCVEGLTAKKHNLMHVLTAVEQHNHGRISQFMRHKN